MSLVFPENHIIQWIKFRRVAAIGFKDVLPEMRSGMMIMRQLSHNLGS
ncbi:hypothetical protein [Nostoc sp.]